MAGSARELVALPDTEHKQPIHYHSLIAETGREECRFREVVVVHGDYIYPEFVVAYRRIDRSDGSPGARLAESTERVDQAQRQPQQATRTTKTEAASGQTGIGLPPVGRGRRREHER